jgi:dTDP-4-amino-4,6-dideoxygalactose transaminase
MMALDLKPGDEVIVPAFTYVATAEVIGLLNLKPVMIDVDEENFNISIGEIRKAITDKTKAIVPVHLYGQCANMEEIMSIAKEFNLYVIEDTAQAIGAEYIYSKNKKKQAGTIGDIGCTSFFPSKNLGCYGDGGAVYTTNKLLAEKITMIANHGQEVKYVHKYIGVNSRLDTIQAAILNIKLDHLNEYINARQKAAQIYDQLLSDINQIQIPIRAKYSSHVYHQYTIIVKENKRDELKKHLESCDIPSMIYYPVPLNEQEAFKFIGSVSGELTNTNKLCKSVLSLPMHTELTLQEQEFISNEIHKYFKNAS